MELALILLVLFFGLFLIAYGPILIFAWITKGFMKNDDKDEES